MNKQKIKITHNLDKTVHTFLVDDPDRLSETEVNRICKRMGVIAILVNGKLYQSNK